MQKISVPIITYNEEKNIRACLESVKWADEIVVVDSQSTDQTRDICREYTDKIFVRSWQGFARQKRSALKHCQNEWILSLDADERVSPELEGEIKKLLGQGETCEGYLVPRRSFFLGKWIRHCGWYPGYQLRFFRKSKADVSPARVHEGFIVGGNIGRLSGDLIHFSHPSLTLSLEKSNRYSTLEAFDRMTRKKVYWYHMLTHPASTFMLKYIRQKGFLEGLEGFLLSSISAFLKMVLYMKIWRLQRMEPKEIEKMKEKYF